MPRCATEGCTLLMGLRASARGGLVAPAGILIRAVQAACSYALRIPPNRGRRRMFRRVVCSGSAIGGGSRAQRPGVRDALVRAVVVAEDFELAQGAEKVVRVPDQGAIEELTAAGLYPPLRDRVHSWHPYTGEHHLDPASARTASKNRARHPVS